VRHPTSIVALTAVAIAAAARIAAAAPQAGVVLDAETGAGIPAASVVAGGGEAITDGEGAFELVALPDGRLDVLVTAPGYVPVLDERRAGEPWRFELEADPTVLGGEVIAVSGARPPATGPVTYDLDADDVRSLPGAGNDALKALQSLPGVARIPFGLGGLGLRGAAPRDSAVFLDGIEVPILYHFGGLTSFYPSGLLGSMEIAPSGFSARYGRAQGGLVELASRPARLDRWRVAGEVSLVDAQVRADGPGPRGGGWSFGLRRSYIDAILAAADVGLTLSPRYWDAQLRWESASTIGRGRWTALAFASSDALDLLSTTDDPTAPDDRLAYLSRFVRAGVRYERQLGKTRIDVTGSAGIDDVQLSYNDEGVVRRSLPLGLRTTVTRAIGSGQIAAGLDLQLSRAWFALSGDAPARPGMATSSPAGLRDGVLWSDDAAVWIEALHPIAGRAITLRPGLRVERYGLTDEWAIDPRLAVLHELGDRVTISESVGLYHQPVSPVDLDPALGGQDLRASAAVQAAVGATVRIGAGIEAGATAFGQSMRDLAADAVTGATPITAGGSRQSGGVGAIVTELSADQFGTYSYKRSIGRGRAWGTELLLRKRDGAWSGWLAYTYARSLRRGDPAREASYLPYVLDQPHVLTAVGSLPLGAWRIGARLRFASGNPYTPVAGAYFDADAQAYQPRDGAVLSARLPAFFQLDLRIDRAWRRAWGELRVFLDVQNVSNRANPEGVTYNFDYSEPAYTRGLPVFPSIGVEYTP
jgi:hypothetical protein